MGGLGVLVDDPFDEGAVARAALGVDGSEAARARRAAWARAHVARDRFVEVYRRIYAGLEDG